MTKPKQTGCRVCGDKKIKSRGLCDRHYRRWMSKYKAFSTDEEKDAFEAKCVRDGWITAKTKGGRPKEDDDPFDQIADEVRAKASEDAQLQEEIDRLKKQQQAREAAAKPGRTKRKSG